MGAYNINDLDDVDMAADAIVKSARIRDIDFMQTAETLRYYAALAEYEAGEREYAPMANDPPEFEDQVLNDSAESEGQSGDEDLESQSSWVFCQNCGERIENPAENPRFCTECSE